MKSYTSKIVLEVEVIHQFGPDDAIWNVTNALHMPAVKGIDVLEVRSNYRLDQEPAADFSKWEIGS